MRGADPSIVLHTARVLFDNQLQNRYSCYSAIPDEKEIKLSEKLNELIFTWSELEVTKYSGRA